MKRAEKSKKCCGKTSDKGYLTNVTKGWLWCCPCSIKPKGKVPVSDLNINWMYQIDPEELVYSDE